MRYSYHYAPWSGPFYFKRVQRYEPEYRKVPDKSEGWPFSIWVVAKSGLNPESTVVTVSIYFCRWLIFHKDFVL